MREGISFGRAVRLLLAGLLFGRCPACGQASMFRTLWDLHTRCPSCGARHELEEGAWLGAVAIGYGIAAVIAILAAVIELNWHPIARAGLDPTWTIALSAIPVTVLSYRPAKGLWFSLMYLFGLASERDPEVPDPPPTA